MAKPLHNRYIRKGTAFLLLVLFAFSVTPKKTLHDLFANHKDSGSFHGNITIPQFISSGYRCQVDNLVVVSPFLTALPSLDMQRSFCFCDRKISPAEKYTSTLTCFSALRGPPSMA